jgi:hypothetical protein
MKIRKNRKWLPNKKRFNEKKDKKDSRSKERREKIKIS